MNYLQVIFALVASMTYPVILLLQSKKCTKQLIEKIGFKQADILDLTKADWLVVIGLFGLSTLSLLMHPMPTPSLDGFVMISVVPTLLKKVDETGKTVIQIIKSGLTTTH